MLEALPAVERAAVQAIGRRRGCHTCGARHATFHADHMPPNAYVKRHAAAPLWRRALLRGCGAAPAAKQRFYPQCEACSGRQARAVRVDARELRTHLGSLRAYHGAGVLAPPAAALAEAAWARVWQDG